MMDTRLKILLVEDEQDLRESIVQFLDLAGFQATGAANASEFYALIGQTRFDVAIVDVGLPDESGYVLTEYLRKHSDLCIIILTAKNEIDERVQGYASGADLYMVKPVFMVELAAAINSIAKRRDERQNASSVKPNAWIFERSSWRLTSPEGRIVKLTGKEFDLIRLLAESGEHTVKRNELVVSLGYPNDLSGGRALDNLVLRLRKKIHTQTGCDNLIHTFHSQGFCIFQEISII